MGMDVYGRSPTSPPGKYFRRSVWGWHPLATFCTKCFPDETAACAYWYSNDGDGLDRDGAIRLAECIEQAVGSGRAAAYITARNASLATLPDEPCALCDASGIRSDAVGMKHGFSTRVITATDHPRRGQTGWCNACDGLGHSRPFATHYHLDLDDLRQFAAFLQACGGFEIC